MKYVMYLVLNSESICLENYINSETPAAGETFHADFGHDH